jgi:hypothetical protein
MLGVVIVIVVLVVVIPVSVVMSGAALAGVLGWFLKDTAEATHEGSELIDLNV